MFIIYLEDTKNIEGINNVDATCPVWNLSSEFDEVSLLSNVEPSASGMT